MGERRVVAAGPGSGAVGGLASSGVVTSASILTANSSVTYTDGTSSDRRRLIRFRAGHYTHGAKAKKKRIMARAHLESLLRARKLDGTLTDTSIPRSPDDRASTGLPVVDA